MQTSETPPAPVASAPPETTPVPQEPVTQDEKILAVIGYLAFLFVVPLIAKPKSKFCQLHAKQSMVMFLMTILVLIVLAAIPLIGSIFTLAVFALYILAMYRAFRGDWWKIPFLSAFSEKIDLGSLYQSAGYSATQLGQLKGKADNLAGKIEEGVKKMGAEDENKPQQ